MRSRFLIAAALAGTLAACSSGSTSTPAQVTCTLPAGVAQPVLVYPAPGSTGISINAGQVVVATSGASLPTTGWDAVIVPNIPGGAATYGVTFGTATPPFPSPSTTPSYASPFYVSSTFGQLVAGAQQQVYLNNYNSSCVPYGPIGSFST